jgi:hypothetical protein
MTVFVEAEISYNTNKVKKRVCLDCCDVLSKALYPTTNALIGVVLPPEMLEPVDIPNDLV